MILPNLYANVVKNASSIDAYLHSSIRPWPSGVVFILLGEAEKNRGLKIQSFIQTHDVPIKTYF
jgi:hypothetical protein